MKLKPEMIEVYALGSTIILIFTTSTGFAIKAPRVPAVEILQYFHISRNAYKPVVNADKIFTINKSSWSEF
jgi:hypothetical protein